MTAPVTVWHGVARRPWAVAVALGLLTTAVALTTVSPYMVGSFQDDAVYVILGRALASGIGYRYIHLPGAPEATHYPPGYPALLALLWRIAPDFPANVVTFERANAVLLGVTAVLTFFLARRARLSTPWACAVAVLGTISIPPLALASMLLSESAYVAVLVGALLAAEPVATGRAPGGRVPPAPGTAIPAPDSFARACIAGVLCGAVVLVRSIGGVILPAAVAVALARRRWRTALGLTAGAVLTVLPWQLWVWTHDRELAPILQGAYGSYGAWVLGPIRRHGVGFAWDTARRKPADLAAMVAGQLAPGLPMAVKIAAIVLFVLFLAYGLVALARRLPVTVAFEGLYLAVVLLWPFPPFRFVWAMWVLVVLTLAAGAASLAEWRPATSGARTWRVAGLVTAVALALGVVRYDILGYRHHWWNTMQASLMKNRSRPLQWLETHPDLPGPTASDIEPALFLYTGRVGVPCSPFVADEYIYMRDTAGDRRALQGTLARFPIASIIASGPACALAAHRIAAVPPAPLVPLDTSSAGLVVYVRSHP